MLDAAQRNRYEEEGVLVPSAPLSSGLLERIRELLDDFLAAHSGIDTDYVPHLIEMDRRWLAIGADPEILDVVTDLIGEDIILWGSALFCKARRGGKATPWHQDARYWPIRPLETCTVWIAVDPSDRDNGCLEVIPGSHRPRRELPHAVETGNDVVLNQGLDPVAVSSRLPRAIELEPGEFSVHDAYLVHGAAPNRSGRRRAGLAYRYMPSTSYFDRELAVHQVRELGVVDISRRQLHLVRGVDRCGRNDLVPASVDAVT